MIPVSRGPEVDRLRSERRLRLSRAILAKQKNAEIEFEGYSVAKDEIVERLNYKCIYCECWLRREGNPIEHFRPKALVQNKGELADKSRYWWLAWSWENLLFACARCNSSYKRNQFPLKPGTPPLDPLSYDLSKESPLLLDPTREDPRLHIRFRWSAKRKRWLPVPLSSRGLKTIEILGLDDDDAPTDHLDRPQVKDLFDDIDSAVKCNNRSAVQAAWRKAVMSLFAPREPFHAVTWDAMDTRFPARVRRKYGVKLPPLGNNAQSPPALPFDPIDDPPALAALPEDLKVHVRANSRSSSRIEKLAALKALTDHRKFDNQELADLFGLQKSTIEIYLRELRKTPGTPPATSP